MEIQFSEEFQKEFSKVKDKTTRFKLLNSIMKLGPKSNMGKPLRHGLKNHRSLRVDPFRVIYTIENNIIYVKGFDHRKGVYK